MKALKTAASTLGEILYLVVLTILITLIVVLDEVCSAIEALKNNKQGDSL